MLPSVEKPINVVELSSPEDASFDRFPRSWWNMSVFEYNCFWIKEPSLDGDQKKSELSPISNPCNSTVLDTHNYLVRIARGNTYKCRLIKGRRTRF